MEYIRLYYVILFYLLNKLTTFLIPEQHELLKRKKVRDQPQQINIFPDIKGPFGNVVLVTLFVFFGNTCG